MSRVRVPSSAPPQTINASWPPMARILGDASDKTPYAASKAGALIVDGVRFTHAAARFWAALLNEVAADYPDCTSMIFEALSGAVLNRSLLFPEMALQLELDRLKPDFRVAQDLQDALAEFELYGPPGSVRIILMAPARSAPTTQSAVMPAQNDCVTNKRATTSEREIKSCDLPLDCVDADIFAYLVAWFMEWSEIQESLWNNDRVEGAFPIHDPDGVLTGRVQFEFTRRHLCEGLYRWRLLIRRMRTDEPGS